MSLLQRLSFKPERPGLEWAIWRRLPALLAWGIVLPVVFAVVRRWASAPATPAQERLLLVGDYTLVGFVVLYVSLLAAVAVGCLVVIVMKGPARVADAYPVNDRSTPAPDGAPIERGH